MTSRLPELIVGGTPYDVDWYLRGLTAAERATDRAWYDGSRTWFVERIEAAQRLRYDPDASVQHYANVRWVQGLCALSLCGPVTAAGRVPWQGHWDHPQVDGEAAFVQRLWDLDRDWVAKFVDTAAVVRLGSNERNCKRTLSRVLRAAVLHHDLPAPAGDTFHLAWLTPAAPDRWTADKAEAAGQLVPLLRRDPLMPELLYHFLASGHAGIEPGLPGATAVLAADGSIGRGRVIEVVLDQLTGRQRVASQRVLAGVLRSLALTSDEVPGVAYLTGVIATADVSVGQVLLPLALELVADEHELVELAAVVAGRPERRPKDALLRWLARGPARLNGSWVQDALRVLGEGDGDVDFRDRAEKAVADLGGAVAPVQTPGSTGLWDLAPVPGPSGSPWFWQHPGDAPTALRVLSSDFVGGSDPRVLEWGVSAVLSVRLPVTLITDAVGALLAASRLSLPQTTRLFETMFLAGGLQLSWAAAIDSAEAACLTLPRPGGLVALLRMLTSYAAEVPAQQLPPALTAFAADPGSTKAQAQARELGALLAGQPLGSYLEQLRAGAAPGGRPLATGRWAAPPGSYASPQPAQRRSDDLDVLSIRVADDNAAVDYRWFDGRAERIKLVGRPLLLDDVLTAIGRQGAGASRRALARVNRPARWAGPIGLAVDLWSAELLTVDSFWELAAGARPQVGQGSDIAQTWLRLWTGRTHRHEPHPYASDDDQPQLDDTVLQLLFLTACESLLLPEPVGSLLSTPSYEDGTLDLDDLVARLRDRPDGTVGPLDLVQALYRLRPVDRARADELVGWSRTTTPALTGPSEAEGVDAVERVRAWVAAGGLPTPQWQPADGWRRWRLTVDLPVSWDECRAAPAEVLSDTGGGPPAGVALVVPLWPDFYARQAPRLLPEFPGIIGLPLHDVLLAALSAERPTDREAAVSAVTALARQGRLQADLAAVAARRLFSEGTGLSRAVPAWQQVLDSDGFSTAWPVALAVADAGAVSTPRAAGLAAMLQLLAGYAHEVPRAAVPAGIQALATERGRTQAQLAAGRLVTALQAGNG